MRTTWIAALALLAAGCGSAAQHSTTSHAGTGAVVTPSGRRLGKIAIDYDKGLLVLDPPVK